MKRKTIIQVLIAGAVFLSACQKNTDIFVPDNGQLNGPDTAWHNAITAAMPVSNLKGSLSFEPYTDSFEVNANVANILTPSGLQVTFPPNSCVNSGGQPFTGKVTVELMLLKKKGDMIRMAKPTTSYDRLLVSGGEIFIRLKKDNVPVHLATNTRLYVRYTDIPVNPLMTFFVGDDSNAERFNWLPNPDTANNKLIPGTQVYEIITNKLNWINCDYFYDTSNTARVNVAAELANYFTNANTIAFTVFKDLRSVVGMYGNASTRKFSTAKLPVGKVITVVVISKQGNDYFLGFESTVTVAVTNGTGTQFVSVKPVKRSLPDILYYLSTL